MPIYEFECKDCKDKHEKICKIGETEDICPKCGMLCKKIMSVSSFIFNGDGFYATDYKIKK